MSPRIIASEKFAEALQAAGIVNDILRVRRIVIDAQAGHALMIHVEYFGDERILDAVPTLDGVEVHTQAQAQGVS